MTSRIVPYPGMPWGKAPEWVKTARGPNGESPWNCSDSHHLLMWRMLRPLTFTKKREKARCMFPPPHHKPGQCYWDPDPNVIYSFPKAPVTADAGPW